VTWKLIRCWWRSDLDRTFLAIPIYIYIYRQPRIKHEHPLRRFELSECVLVVAVVC